MRTALIAAHLAFAVLICGGLLMQWLDARGRVVAARSLAAQDRAETERVQGELERMQALRDGLKRDDPFVIEYIARDRLKFTGPGEMAPPRMAPAASDRR